MTLFRSFEAMDSLEFSIYRRNGILRYIDEMAFFRYIKEMAFFRYIEEIAIFRYIEELAFFRYIEALDSLEFSIYRRWHVLDI